jgi:hypothetical protein
MGILLPGSGFVGTKTSPRLVVYIFGFLFFGRNPRTATAQYGLLLMYVSSRQLLQTIYCCKDCLIVPGTPVYKRASYLQSPWNFQYLSIFYRRQEDRPYVDIINSSWMKTKSAAGYICIYRNQQKQFPEARWTISWISAPWSPFAGQAWARTSHSISISSSARPGGALLGAILLYVTVLYIYRLLAPLFQGIAAPVRVTSLIDIIRY